MSLNRFFLCTGTTKQAFHQNLSRYCTHKEALAQLELIVWQARRDHPGMGLRDLYYMIRPQHLGRDRFERHFKALGYGIGVKRSYRRTTDSRGVIRFDNLIADLKLEGINQVWVSDITYYRIGDVFYYLTFVMDIYSRRIVGYSVSETLRTIHTTIPALQMGLKTRDSSVIEGLIIHSDGGGQYYSTEFKELTKKAKMRNSMGETVFENPHAERINGIIKNNYIKSYAPTAFAQLKAMTKKAVEKYNLEKTHSALGRISPIQYEELLTKKPLIDKRKKEAKKEKFTSSFNFNLKSKVVNTIQA
jgi:putative transposase